MEGRGNSRWADGQWSIDWPWAIWSAAYEADFTGATLRDADLSGSYLARAKLCAVDLTGATLYGADLEGASLCDADLSEVDLRKANLDDADLSGATLPDGTLFD